MTYATMMASFLNDASQRVRHAAIGALTLLAETYAEAGTLYTNICKALLPVYVTAMSSASGNCARVRIHAATALISLLAQGEFACPDDVVVPHLEIVLRALTELMALPSYPARLQVRPRVLVF